MILWQPNAYCWDADGVLVDSEPLNWQAWEGLFAELGHSLTLEEYLPTVGISGRARIVELFGRRGISPDPDATMRRWWEIFSGISASGIPPMPLNVALVRSFAQLHPHIPQVVVSSSHRPAIEEYLVVTGLTDIISQIVCAGDQPDIRRKPAPDLYLLAARHLGLPPAACLAFEDTAPGVSAAKAAGMSCVALPHKFTLDQNFSGADLVIAAEASRDAAAILRRLALR